MLKLRQSKPACALVWRMVSVPLPPACSCAWPWVGTPPSGSAQAVGMASQAARPSTARHTGFNTLGAAWLARVAGWERRGAAMGQKK